MHPYLKYLTIGLLFFGVGCFGSGPKATRVRGDNSHRLPPGTVHVVEGGLRTQSAFVDATPGFPNAFAANWVTMLVPFGPTNDGMHGRAQWSARGDPAKARAIANLPKFRNAFYLKLYAESACRRFGQTTAWVLGINPLVVGFEELRPFLPERSTQGPVFTAYVTDDNLRQPIRQLVFFPVDFGSRSQTVVPTNMRTLIFPAAKPTEEVLDALVDGALGPSMSLEQVELYPELLNCQPVTKPSTLTPPANPVNYPSQFPFDGAFVERPGVLPGG